MTTRWIALLALAALLGGCGAAPVASTEDGGRWNGGTWNSVLGYHGPANAMIAGGP
jgi:hypothetical protein